MSKRTLLLGVVAGAWSLLAACAAQDPVEQERGQTSVGKADAVAGSCAGEQPACGGPGSGQCWCDELCAQYGDCCADAAQACGVDECLDDADCDEGLACADAEGALECIAIQTCEGELGQGTVDCPAGWRLAPNNAGQAYCIRDDVAPAEAVEACATLEIPAYARDYCDYAENGYYGYLWDACPEPTEADVGPDGEQLCVMSPAVLPVGSRHYCHYIEDGYFGFYWRLEDDPDYACPEGMRQSDNGAGAGYCTVSTDAMPGPVLAACEDDGSQVGFAWRVGCGG